MMIHDRRHIVAGADTLATGRRYIAEGNGPGGCCCRWSCLGGEDAYERATAGHVPQVCGIRSSADRLHMLCGMSQ
jgi:hypothetical protein